MTRNVWHKRFHGDALNGYMGLTLEQRGAYTTILDLLYDTDWEIGIPDRERWLAGHLNVSTRRWKALRQELIDAGKLDVIDGYLSNNRYRKERENALETSRKRAESGAKGGKATSKPVEKTVQNQQTEQASASDLPLYACATEAEAEADKSDIANATSHRVKRGSRLESDWEPRRPYPPSVEAMVAKWPPGREAREIDGFRDYWTTRTRDATKLDWDKTWHNRIRDQHDRITRETRNGRGQSRSGYGTTVDAAGDWLAEG